MSTFIEFSLNIIEPTQRFVMPLREQLLTLYPKSLQTSPLYVSENAIILIN